MPKFLSLLKIFSIGLVIFTAGAIVSMKQPSPATAEVFTRYVVVFNEGVTENQITSIVTTAGATLVRTLPNIRMAFINIPDLVVLNALSANPNVTSITQPQPIPFPSVVARTTIPTPPISIYDNFQWHIRRTGADQVWSTGETASHNTVVAVIDVGVANNHPELASNIVYEKCFSQVENPCVTYPRFPSAAQGDHGTLVAGVIASILNNGGTIGVAPNVGLANYNVAELPLPDLPNVYDASIWEAIYDATEQGFEVINLSAGNPYSVPLSPELQVNVDNWQLVLDYAHSRGSLFVNSAGNENLNLDDADTLQVPCELDHVLCVGATNIRPQPQYPQPGFYDERAYYSNHSATKLDIAAPGGDCGPNSECYDATMNPLYFTFTTSVDANPVCALLENCPTSYNATIGTSLAAPHAAGVAALIYDAYFDDKGVNPSPNHVRTILRNTADPVPGYPELGVGIVDAVEAVEEAAQ